VRRRWLLATLAAVVVCLPIAVFGVAQSHQIAFLATRNSATASLILVDQWFGNAALAILCWALIVTALVAAVVVWRRSRTRSPLTLLAALWLIVPSGLLLIGNDFVTPMYSNRYLSFSTPAAALLIALGLSALGKRWVGVVGVTAVVALAAPTLVQQRGPYAKDGGSDWAQVSHLIGASARPGEAIVFDNSTRPSRRPRLAMRLYPQDYRGLADVELVTPFAQTPSLWDVTAPLTRVAEKLATTPTVWLLELHGSSDNLSGTDVAELEHLGFTQVTVTTVNRTEIYRMSRTTND
jgi:mannosyltransferase